MNNLKNQTISLIKIWYKDSILNLNIKRVAESTIEYLIYYWFLNVVLVSHYLSLTALLVLICLRYVSKNILINKQKFYNGEFDLVLLRPTNPILSTFVYGLSLIDLITSGLIILMMIIAYGNYILITLSVIVLISSIYLISRSLLILDTGLQIFDKLPVLVVLIIFSLLYKSIGNTNFNFIFQLGLTIFSLFVFYLSIKLWQKIIQKYIRQ